MYNVRPSRGQEAEQWPNEMRATPFPFRITIYFHGMHAYRYTITRTWEKKKTHLFGQPLKQTPFKNKRNYCLALVITGMVGQSRHRWLGQRRRRV